jgi:hypothetical protein
LPPGPSGNKVYNLKFYKGNLLGIKDEDSFIDLNQYRRPEGSNLTIADTKAERAWMFSDIMKLEKKDPKSNDRNIEISFRDKADPITGTLR